MQTKSAVFLRDYLEENNMISSPIRNIVFDIGNVVVRWDPILIIERTFERSDQTELLRDAIFGHPLWLSLNRGEVTEAEAKRVYARELGLPDDVLEKLFFHIKDSQSLREDTIELMAKLQAQNYRLFALTDNVHEIVRYLKEAYSFWKMFENATVSAEVGALKPSAEIFHHLLSTNGLAAEQTLFFDDVPKNVAGAKQIGMQAFVFDNAASAITDLRSLGVSVTF